MSDFTESAKREKNPWNLELQVLPPDIPLWRALPFEVANRRPDFTNQEAEQVRYVGITVTGQELDDPAVHERLAAAVSDAWPKGVEGSKAMVIRMPLGDLEGRTKFMLCLYGIPVEVSAEYAAHVEGQKEARSDGTSFEVTPRQVTALLKNFSTGRINVDLPKADVIYRPWQEPRYQFEIYTRKDWTSSTSGDQRKFRGCLQVAVYDTFDLSPVRVPCCTGLYLVCRYEGDHENYPGEIDELVCRGIECGIPALRDTVWSWFQRTRKGDDGQQYDIRKYL